MDETTLTKARARKLNFLRRSVGDKLGDEIFPKWLARQAAASAPQADPVARKIETALAGFAGDRSFNLSMYGYTIRRARGKDATGFVAVKNNKRQ